MFNLDEREFTTMKWSNFWASLLLVVVHSINTATTATLHTYRHRQRVYAYCVTPNGELAKVNGREKRNKKNMVNKYVKTSRDNVKKIEKWRKKWRCSVKKIEREKEREKRETRAHQPTESKKKFRFFRRFKEQLSVMLWHLNVDNVAARYYTCCLHRHTREHTTKSMRAQRKKTNPEQSQCNRIWRCSR